MGLSHLSFLRDWKNPADFPTVEPDEATVRADLQYHPDAIKDYINGTLIPSHDSLTSAKHSHDNKTVLDGITANDVAKWRGTIGTFRVNVTYSDGVYSADKTFDKIKAAYDAGQLPYVVLTGGTLDFIYTLAYFSVPDGTGKDFIDFERYRIEEDTLETETLRVYSYTTDSGSNIVKRTSAFNVPSGTTPDATRPTVMFGAQIDTSNNHVQMDDQDAYDRIRTAYENGSTVMIELYYDSSRSDILPLVTVGANYLSFAATTGYYFSPGHDDIAVMSNIMVTLHSDYTSHCYKNIIYEK